MKFKREHFCCSPRLLREIEEIREVEAAVGEVVWTDHFTVEVKGRMYEHQSGYNRALAAGLHKFGWTMQPKLCTVPRLIGDASKNDVFVEVQFGNSATLYRDYYKFHYGLMHGLLSLAVLIVPTTPTAFFPTRPNSIANMAEYDLACRCYKILPIPVPILVIGLLPENKELGEEEGGPLVGQLTIVVGGGGVPVRKRRWRGKSSFGLNSQVSGFVRAYVEVIAAATAIEARRQFSNLLRVRCRSRE